VSWTHQPGNPPPGHQPGNLPSLPRAQTGLARLQLDSARSEAAKPGILRVAKRPTLLSRTKCDRAARWHRATTVFANTPAMPSSSRAEEWNERSSPYLRRNAARCRWAVPVSVRLEAIWPSPYRRALRAA
jgi:hypothetical protein